MGVFNLLGIAFNCVYRLVAQSVFVPLIEVSKTNHHQVWNTTKIYIIILYISVTFLYFNKNFYTSLLYFILFVYKYYTNPDSGNIFNNISHMHLLIDLNNRWITLSFLQLQSFGTTQFRLTVLSSGKNHSWELISTKQLIHA